MVNSLSKKSIFSFSNRHSLQIDYGRSGHVYIIRAIGSDRIKIGHSLEPQKRLLQLKFPQAPFQLELVDQIYCIDAHELEQYIHKLYTKYRVHGEWFSTTNMHPSMYSREGLLISKSVFECDTLETMCKDWFLDFCTYYHIKLDFERIQDNWDSFYDNFKHVFFNDGLGEMGWENSEGLMLNLINEKLRFIGHSIISETRFARYIKSDIERVKYILNALDGLLYVPIYLGSHNEFDSEDNKKIREDLKNYL
jgi:hypothetical protein